MAWTAADLSALEAAIASGVTKVKYQDREVTYGSLADMRAALAAMRRAIAGSTRPKFAFTQVGKGV
jgi:hypothetical protein